MSSEEEYIKKVIENMAKAENTAEKLGYNKASKRIRPISSWDHDPDQVIEVTPEDLDFASLNPELIARIVVSGELIEKMGFGPSDVYFNSMDHGDVYSLIKETQSGKGVPGTIYRSLGNENTHFLNIGKVEDCVRVIIREIDPNTADARNDRSLDVRGFVLGELGWAKIRVEIVPIKNQIFSRTRGIIETGVIGNTKVAIFGLGSMGSNVVLELTKSGISNFWLGDHDRLEVCNVSRHVAGLPHVGRFKTKIMAQLVREINPYANVQTFEKRVCWENYEAVSKIIRWADLVICFTDDGESRRILNRLCVENEKVIIIAGAFRRAHGGQIFRVRPKLSPCYQCFLMELPEHAKDEEVTGIDQAERLGYTDRPVPIEPGLSIDIAPISIMAAKLAIQELLKDAETTLRPLDKDLIAPWYLWLNRREMGTQYENLEPLEFNVGGMHVLRWYGIDLKRHPDCPVCGDFSREIARRYGLTISKL